jgi:hypothetical protein
MAARTNNTVVNYWAEHFINDNLCSLCGNTGCIDTRETAVSPKGQKVGRLNHCICPNGQRLRELGGIPIPRDSSPKPGKGGSILDEMDRDGRR